MGKLYPQKYITLKFCSHQVISTCVTLVAIQRTLPESPLGPLSHWQLALYFLIINPIVRHM